MKTLILILIFLLILVLIINRVHIMSMINSIDLKHISGGKPKYAYVSTVFRGDKYIDGMMTLAASLKKTETKYDIVCMVTPDVSEGAKNRMKSFGIVVVDVPYLEYKTKPSITKKQQDAYDSWLGVSYTKWNCLNLDYDKVLFLDVDLIVKENVDHLFNINSPASRFSAEIFKRKPFPKRVPPKRIDYEVNNRGTVINGSIVLLTPNKTHFVQLKEMINEMEPFGFKSLSGTDEQSLSYFMSVYKKGPKLTWTNLDAKYLYSWRNTTNIPKIYIHNFTGTYKPWIKDLRTEYPDTLEWYNVYNTAKEDYPNLFPDLILENL